MRTGFGPGEAPDVAAYVIQQSPDGQWYAEGSHGEGRETNIAGWDGLARLLASHRLSWDSPSSISRFRAQFGEPPADVDIQQMGTVPPA